MAGPASSGQHPAGPAPGPAGPAGPATEPSAAGTDAESVPGQSADGAGARSAAAEGIAGADAESVTTQSADGAESEGEAGGKPAGLRAVFAALAANLGIAATKFIAFAITGSASMLAESVHSVADSGNQILLLLGRNRANRARTQEHPFGFGRERYFYAFIVAVVLFTGGAAFSVYEGIHKITHPEPVKSPGVAL